MRIARRGAAGALVTVLAGVVSYLLFGVLSEKDSRGDVIARASDDANATSPDPASAISRNIETLTRGAESGDPLSQFELAMALYREYTRTADTAAQFESLRWLKEAASAGHRRSQTQLARRYLTGQGVVQDFERAASWFRAAAEQGSPQAMYGLGNMARLGRASGVDLMEAYAWLNVAAARGERRAIDARQKVMNRLTDSELEKAQRLSRELDTRITLPGSSRP